jgi:hypothetical protein
MNTALWMLVGAYALLVLLLVKVLVLTPWQWWVKLAATALVGVTLWLSWTSLPQLAGWPTVPAVLPARFNVVGLHVQEPDKSGASKGAIYFWVTDMNLGGTARPVPRAFVLPFSAELQLKTVDVGNKLHKNLPQIGERIEGPGHAAHPNDLSHAGSRGVSIEFFDLPDPLFPEK